MHAGWQKNLLEEYAEEKNLLIVALAVCVVCRCVYVCV